MRQLDVVTMPVVNENRHLEGLITNSDIAYSYMDILDNRILSRARTQYKNICGDDSGGRCNAAIPMPALPKVKWWWLPETVTPCAGRSSRMISSLWEISGNVR